MRHSSSILCFGNDHILVETRQRILSNAGFQSRRAETLEELHLCFESSAVDLLLICHSSTLAEREEAKHLAKRQAIPALILLLHTGVPSTTDEAQAGFDSRQGPTALLRAVDELLTRAAVSGHPVQPA